jgi:hypothetical protein
MTLQSALEISRLATTTKVNNDIYKSNYLISFMIQNLVGTVCSFTPVKSNSLVLRESKFRNHNHAIWIDEKKVIKFSAMKCIQNGHWQTMQMSFISC